MRIDAHIHLWRYNATEFGWIDDRSTELRRDFLLPDLDRVMYRTGVDEAIAVQARPALDETRWLLEMARASSRICGVVGWIPLAAENLPAILEEFCEESKLFGFREMLQGEPAGYMDRPEINRGMASLTAGGYAYDLLLRADQLQEATRFADRHTHQRLVLNHAAKPRIAEGLLAPWKTYLRALAEREHVTCKLSGLVTEADWNDWTIDTLRPYLDVCVEAFGTRRLIAASDWPVCLLATTCERWWQVLADYFATFSEHERAEVYGENALRTYRCPTQSSSDKVSV